MEKDISIEKAMVRKVKPGSEDLPKKAVKCNDPEVNNILKEIRAFEIAFYNKHSCSVNDLIFDYRGHKLKKYSVLHPQAEGYYWFSGYTVQTKYRRQIMLLTGWMQPWYEGGAPAGVIYTIGNVSKETILDFVKVYRDHVEAWAKRIEEEFTKPYNIESF